MWKKIGGTLGIIAILALLVALVQVIQDRNAENAQSIARVTQLALLEEQLELAREMVTLQAGDGSSPSTATAAAERVVQLEATSAALGTAQAQVMFSAATPTATTPPQWNEQSNSVPDTGTQIIRDLAPGEFLYLTGGRFTVNKVFCGNDANQICVLVFESSHSQRVIVDQLIARNNYLARTHWFNYEDLIRMHETYYWKWPNCQSESGCAKATIYHLIDGKLEGGPTTLTRP